MTRPTFPQMADQHVVFRPNTDLALANAIDNLRGFYTVAAWELTDDEHRRLRTILDRRLDRMVRRRAIPTKEKSR